jgi:hypothetical protein
MVLRAIARVAVANHAAKYRVNDGLDSAACVDILHLSLFISFGIASCLINEKKSVYLSVTSVVRLSLLWRSGCISSQASGSNACNSLHTCDGTGEHPHAYMCNGTCKRPHAYIHVMVLASIPMLTCVMVPTSIPMLTCVMVPASIPMLTCV